VIEADGEGFEAAHGETGDGVIFATFGDVVLVLDGGDDFGFKGLGEEVEVGGDEGSIAPDGDGMAGEVFFAVAERHDDDHGNGFAGGDEGVEDEVGVAVVGPAGFNVRPAVQEIEDGIAAFAVGVVAGWRVDDVGALVAGEAFYDLGGVEVAIDVAVGDVGGLPGCGWGCGDEDLGAEVVDGGQRVGVLDGDGVERVKLGDAVFGEGVGVVLRREWGGGEDPGAVVAFGHGLRGEEGVGVDDDLCGGRGHVAEGYGAVRVDLVGLEWDGGLLGGGAEGDGEDGEQDVFAVHGGESIESRCSLSVLRCQFLVERWENLLV